MRRSTVINPTKTIWDIQPQQQYFETNNKIRNSLQNNDLRIVGSFLLGGFALVIAVTFAVLYGSWFYTNNGRWHRDEARWRSTNTLHADLLTMQNTILENQQPIGFMAYKNETQPLAMNTLGIAIDWRVDGGAPAYDASDGAIDLPTGLWTTKIAAKYKVSVTMCWAAGSFGSRKVALVMNGNPNAIFFGSFDAIFGATCVPMSHVMDLSVNMTIQVSVVQSSLAAFGDMSIFSIERIATTTL